ncbi:PilZ domain-containing protein [Acidithiobacillus sp. AMEEHan]|uniref:PilZ domain-containing protein n=1 Tax=Acidithiobacillus sp. AMEEHan TaxID=2994951 RepID=UPI0027E47127|nr:PilZ domain-containing protein [Acidithiobacillus sp. AMEEHan]
MDGPGVAITAKLPVAIRSWSGQEEEFADFMGDNRVLLRALLIWEEEGGNADEDERSALTHLQIKTDLLLTLLSAGIRAQEPLPAAHPCELRGDSLQITLDDDWQPLDFPLQAAIYLHPRLAMPLRLPGAGFEQVLTDSVQRLWRFPFRLSPGVQEMLDRLIFRHHRREVARLRESMMDHKTRKE